MIRQPPTATLIWINSSANNTNQATFCFDDGFRREKTEFALMACTITSFIQHSEVCGQYESVSHYSLATRELNKKFFAIGIGAVSYELHPLNAFGAIGWSFWQVRE